MVCGASKFTRARWGACPHAASHARAALPASRLRENLAPIIKRERKRLRLRLRELRTARGLTQEQAAEMIGIHPKYMPRVEAGRANLTVDTLIAASVAYEVSLSDLFLKAQEEDTAR